VLSLISSNVAGSTKKSTVMALYMIFYAIGNLIGKSFARRFGARLELNDCPLQALKLTSLRMLPATPPLSSSVPPALLWPSLPCFAFGPSTSSGTEPTKPSAPSPPTSPGRIRSSWTSRIGESAVCACSPRCAVLGGRATFLSPSFGDATSKLSFND